MAFRPSQFYSVFQGLGGGLQSNLLITPWLTLSLMWWWELMDAEIPWKVRRRQTKVMKSIDASRMYCTFRPDEPVATKKLLKNSLIADLLCTLQPLHSSRLFLGSHFK